MKGFKFTAEDFKDAKPIGMSEVGCIQAASIANDKLESWLGPVVYGNMRQVCDTHVTELHIGDSWSRENKVYNTHQARLFGVTEIEKKECEHKGLGSVWEGFSCSKCGVLLNAIWQEVEKE